MHSLGINVGSSSLKIVLLENDSIVFSKVFDHEGNFVETLKNFLKSTDLPNNIPALVTGTEGRYLLNINNVIESLCIEEALKALNYSVDAVVSLGGENFVVYTIDRDGKIITSFSGNKCASGTGEFFKQQLGRMDMVLADVEKIPDDARVYHLSSRCSVFMKSDCTHKLNKGEATKNDIVLSLSDVMATKVVDFLKRARIKDGKVLLSGGVTRNKYIVRFVKEKMPDVEFIVPAEAPYFEALGAALLARTSGSPMSSPDQLFKPHKVQFARFDSLRSAEGRVHYISPTGRGQGRRRYILGVDGGSTTTKVALIDMETDEIVPAHY
jgi:predicted CoA-substrate-specific enzyme activase